MSDKPSVFVVTPEVVRLANKIMRMSDAELTAYRRDFGELAFMASVRQLAAYVQHNAIRIAAPENEQKRLTVETK